MSVFAVIDTETTGLNKRYDRIIELAAVRADAYFNPVDSWHTLLNPDTNAVSTTRGVFLCSLSISRVGWTGADP